MTNNVLNFLFGDVIKKHAGPTIQGNVAHNKNKLISLEGTYDGEAFTTAKWINVTSQGGAGMVGNTGSNVYGRRLSSRYFPSSVHDGFEVDDQGHLTYKFKDSTTAAVLIWVTTETVPL
jgi:hypothetical protein